MIRLSLREREFLYAQLAALEHAGVPLVDALGSLSERPGGPAAAAAGRIRASILAGSTLHEAMNALPRTFSDYERGLLGASERSGHLEAGFGALERHFGELRRRRTQFVMGLLYPFLVVNAAIVVLAVPVWFQGGLSAFLRAVAVPAGLLYGSIGLGFLVTRLASEVPAFGALVHRAFLWIPLFGSTHRAACTARFLRALAALLEAAVSVVEAIPSAARSCGNVALAPRWARAAYEPSTAARLSERLRPLGILDTMHLQMIVTGEASGQLCDALQRVAALLEARVKTRVQAALVVIPLFAFLVVAAMIAFRVIQFWTGYFERVTTIE